MKLFDSGSGQVRAGQSEARGAVARLVPGVTWVEGPTVMASTWELTAWLASNSMEEATLPWEAAWLLLATPLSPEGPTRPAEPSPLALEAPLLGPPWDCEPSLLETPVSAPCSSLIFSASETSQPLSPALGASPSPPSGAPRRPPPATGGWKSGCRAPGRGILDSLALKVGQLATGKRGTKRISDMV